MTPSIYEILESTAKIKQRAARVEYLKKNATKPVLDVLKAALDPRIKWLLPEGTPPYTADPGVNTHNVLMHETRKFYLFLEGYTPDNVSKTRREQLFIELLESVHPDDAKLLIAAKDKKLLWKNITPEVVNEAFPGFIMETKSARKSTDMDAE